MPYANAKAWAKAQGYNVTEGRGRLPRDVAAAFQKALAAEPGLIGKPAKASKPDLSKPRTRPRSAAQVKRDKAAAKPAPEVIDRPPLWPAGTTATMVHGGKTVKVSMCEVCSTCGVSLSWCLCHVRPEPMKPLVVRPDGTGHARVTLEAPE